MSTDVRAHDRPVDCGNSYTLRSFMPMKCNCLFVTSNSTSTRPLIFNVFSYNGVYASPFGVRNTSLSLRLVVPRVPSAACIAGASWRYINLSNTRPIFRSNFDLNQLVAVFFYTVKTIMGVKLGKVGWFPSSCLEHSFAAKLYQTVSSYFFAHIVLCKIGSIGLISRPIPC